MHDVATERAPTTAGVRQQQGGGNYTHMWHTLPHYPWKCCHTTDFVPGAAHVQTAAVQAYGNGIEAFGGYAMLVPSPIDPTTTARLREAELHAKTIQQRLRRVDRKAAEHTLKATTDPSLNNDDAWKERATKLSNRLAEITKELVEAIAERTAV